MTSLLANTLKKKILVGRNRAIIGRIKYPLRKWMFKTATEKFGLKIVKREDLLNNSEKYYVLQFGFEESILVSEPYNRSDRLPRSIKNNIGTFTLKKPFISEVTNAELVGPTAVGFDEDGNIISETVTPVDLKIGVPIQTFILKLLPSFGAPQLDTAYSLVSCWPPNYYNWLMDSLIQIEGLEYYQEKTGKKPVLIIDSNPQKWKVESLKLLGYEPDDCMQWNMSRIKVKRLIVPSFRRNQRLMSPTACRWLRQRMFSNLPDVGSEKLSFSSKIYISRPKSAGRQVINEDDVLEALTPFGFVPYTLENISFSDQVRLFSQAEIVVAPHGAGLTNIVFAQNLTVIELFDSRAIPSFFLLAKALGFHYGCLTSDPNGKQDRNKFTGIMVDIARLRELVTEMLYVCC
jgi:hypothetical protein